MQKRPADCQQDTKCPNMEIVFEGWDKTTWLCKKCGRRLNTYKSL